MEGEVTHSNNYETRVSELKAKKLELAAIVIELDSEIRAIYAMVIIEKWLVKPGTIVKDKRYGKLHKVSHVEIHSSDSFDYIQKYKPWIMAFPIKQSGQYSTAARNLYGDWELA
jgi:hypothetical protein